MNEGSMFHSPEEVAKELAQEIREFKEVLRDISRKLGQMETRAKRAFPSAFPPAPRRRASKGESTVAEQPTLSPDDALRVYDELVQLARANSRDQVQQRLESMGLPDLALLCRELGVSMGKKKPSRPALIAGVIGRVSESVMLSSSNLRERSKKSVGEALESSAPSVGPKEDASLPSTEMGRSVTEKGTEGH
jgi:hypothetical protein